MLNRQLLHILDLKFGPMAYFFNPSCLIYKVIPPKHAQCMTLKIKIYISWRKNEKFGLKFGLITGFFLNPSFLR